MTDGAATASADLTDLLASRAAEALYFMDAAGRVLYMNPAAEKLFGWTQREIGDRTLHDVIHHTRPDGTAFPMSTCPLGRVMSSGEAATDHEDVFIHKDGSFVPVLCSNAPVVTDGVITGAVLVVRDATERRRATERLEAEARALAEADRRKDEFIGLLAHELRNPIAAILHAVDVLADPGSPTAPLAVEVIGRQARHQARMLDDLLEVARITRGKIDLDRRPLDLAAVVRAEVADRRGLLERRGLRVELDLPAAPLWIDGDPTRLAQVLGNLLTNAARFSPAAAAIEVSLRAAGEHARLAVRDHGVGIAPELLPRVFEPFVQGVTSLDRGGHAGLGVGLTLVRGLVALHGGRVEARSAGAGHGAEMIVELPLLAADARPVAAASPAGAPRLAPAALRVLLIEDNLDLALVTAELLGRTGHAVEVAHDGEVGVERALAWRPDVVVCDLGIPRLDGYEVARRLRAAPTLAGVRLIALSGYAQRADRERSRAAGFDVHLAKPATIEALRAALAPPVDEVDPVDG